MSVPRRRNRRVRKERSSLQILEESFHLLRSVDVRYFWIYFLGSAPFVAGLLYFVADMSRSSLAQETVIPASLAMAGLYFWMRYCQARFCEGVWDAINPGSPAAIRGWDRFGNLSALFIVQALQVPLLLAGALFVVPVGWVIAMLQNATVLTFTKNFQRRSLRGLVKSSLAHSHYEWGQNHGILIVLLFVSAFVWFNVVGSCLALATFAKAFFGVESAFTLSPLVALFNSTFFLGSLLLTYLVISPMMKAVYVLRCFYAESFHTGEDLLSRLASCKSGRGESSIESAPAERTGRAVVIVLSFLFFWFGSSPLHAEGGTSSVAFEGALSETMEQKKYQWQLSRHADAEDLEGDQSWMARRMKELAEATQESLRALEEWFDKMLKRAERDTLGDAGGSAGSGIAGIAGLQSTFSLALVAIVVGLVVWLAFLIYRKYRVTAARDDVEKITADTVDLQSEDIVASQLPEGEWMRLAREQISRGDGRLAIRALFLATLANLGEEGVIKIARFKSNRDYRKELELKVRKRSVLRRAFDENTTLFEEAWYGWHPVSEETVDDFLKNHGTIARESGAVMPSPRLLQEGTVT
ncbi:MAG: DUF4129 domain-containing protein [Verrucomicrobiales bacterium]